ncbi:sigma-70 family RNA polymerase sigma factor [Mycobacterium sp. SM1]|uniref:sigma-70 family RNA polymerase sigma factor n=1 Tax=Mycobacterium sp. SM1 TaxID=2816243 RepID=UPI001BCAE9FF|nr:sigma-70 family RNA polymerase sigma factor [Mycobacterium sp. SM1]MBS4728826.1 sigma-70 family RNA polymerase sigma factor [Mycobacterium sp. SM1]
MDRPETGAMRTLHSKHAAALLRYVYRLTGDTAHAHTVVQQTLLRARQHPEVLDGNERSARAWLFTVARGLILDDARGVRFGAEVVSPDGPAAPESGPSDGGSALDRALVADAIAQLPAEDRAIVSRAYYHGWTTGQIGADLGIADDTVKSRLHYALRTLRQTLLEMGVAQ